ncbi:hypothetical protein AVEN_160587-1 [Araneus ventricosus]|uniref:Uncharacterized protein n=1 Tax=Araneus ventricosus TaxID=182803 RepID=A0A4Y2QV45_ARAVE|nr:hypothetical protein AVEN_160587-1 [Araneus ventricosus]
MTSISVGIHDSSTPFEFVPSAPKPISNLKKHPELEKCGPESLASEQSRYNIVSFGLPSQKSSGWNKCVCRDLGRVVPRGNRRWGRGSE